LPASATEEGGGDQDPTVIDTDPVTEPAVPAEIPRLVVCVPVGMEVRSTARVRVRLELAGTDPDVAPSESQPELSFAVHESEASPVFVNVIDLVVCSVPKSTDSGETASWPSVVPPVEGTVSDTDTVADPAPLSPETFMLVVYFPGARDPRWAERDSVEAALPQTVPDDVPRESQPALSLADQDSALPLVFVRTTDALVPLLPKSTETGET